MAFGDYLTSINMDPALASRLEQQYGPPAPNASPAAAPAPDQFEQDAIADAKKYGAPVAAPGDTNYYGGSQQAARDTAGQKTLTPDELQASDAKEVRNTALAGATPQGPAGNDGFPTYRDLSNQGGAMQTAPAAPMRTIKAHWQPGTRSESKSIGMAADELESGQTYRDASAGNKLLAGDKHLQAAQMQAEADVGYAQAHREASQRAAAKTAFDQEQKAMYVEREQEKLSAMSLAAQEKIDPEAAKGSAGTQLLSTIAIALGQFGASITGGQNTALQMVNANIDRRINAQRDNIANAGKALQGEQSLYRQNLEAFGDKDRATVATKMMFLDQAKAMADEQYAKAKGTANEGQYHAFVAGVQDERAKSADDFARLTHTQVQTTGNEHYVPTQTVGGPGAGGAKGKEALYVPSLGGYARDGESARKLNASGAVRMQINEDLHTIDKLLEESKGLSTVTDYGRMQEIRDEIASRKNNVLQRTTVLRGQGAMSNGDKDVAEVGAQLAAIDPQLKTTAQIERMRKGVKNVATLHQQDHRLEGESNGIQLGREGYVQGPHGPEARAQLAGQNKVVTKKTESVDDLIEKPKGVSRR